MIDNRRSFWLACALALLSACASSVQAPQASKHLEPGAPSASFTQAPEPEPDPDPDPEESAELPPRPLRNPYAPKRLQELGSYAWENPKQPACVAQPAPSPADEVRAIPVKLSFFGSVAAFPLLSDEASPAPAPAEQPAPELAAEEARADAAPSLRRDPDFVVASLRPRLRSCFSSLLDRSADAEGSIRFALGLGCDGEVQTISASATGVDEPTVECLFAVVAPALFDPPAGGHATIHVPVVFKNAGR